MLDHVAWFFGGLLFANTIPHWVAGVSGKPFQSPFAKPPGEGLSSSTVNMIWAGFNGLLAYLLLWHVGHFDVRNGAHVAWAAIPAFLLSVVMANRFGRFNGGNNPESGRA